MSALWLSAADLHHLWRTPTGTIYRWAHEDHWRRTSAEHRPVRYHAGDANETFQRRRETHTEQARHLKDAAKKRSKRVDAHRRAAEKRFWARVDKSGECWIWTGAKISAGGYGQLRWFGVPIVAHRLSYQLAVGPIPDGRQIDHNCENKSCVRPDHLQAVTPRENTRLSVLRRAARVTVDVSPSGEA